MNKTTKTVLCLGALATATMASPAAHADQTPAAVGSSQIFRTLADEQGTVGSLCTEARGCAYDEPASSFIWESAKLGVEFFLPSATSRDNVPTLWTEIARLNNLANHGGATGVLKSLFPLSTTSTEREWYTLHFGPTNASSAAACAEKHGYEPGVEGENAKKKIVVCSPLEITEDEYRAALK